MWKMWPREMATTPAHGVGAGRPVHHARSIPVVKSWTTGAES